MEEAGWGEAGSQHPGKQFLMLMRGSGRLSDPTSLDSISRVAGAVDSWSPKPQAAAERKQNEEKLCVRGVLCTQEHSFLFSVGEGPWSCGLRVLVILIKCPVL